jgi:hypothetical protein
MLEVLLLCDPACEPLLWNPPAFDPAKGPLWGEPQF